jgi:hypothetical protein
VFPVKGAGIVEPGLQSLGQVEAGARQRRDETRRHLRRGIGLVTIDHEKPLALFTEVPGEDGSGQTLTHDEGVDFQNVLESLKKSKYDVFNNNCEHFIYFLKEKKFVSPQLKIWGLAVTLGIITYFILKRK